MRHFFGCGDPAAVEQLMPAQTAALAEVTVEHFMDGRGENAREVRRVKFKLADKIEALELLSKHHKLYVERHQHGLGGSIAERLNAPLARIGERIDDDELGPDDPPRGRPARKAARSGKRARAR